MTKTLGAWTFCPHVVNVLDPLCKKRGKIFWNTAAFAYLCPPNLIMEVMIKPEYIFESSWEICNKIGGIYTVLSSRAHTLQKDFHDRVIFIGPDFHLTPPDFLEDVTLFSDWKKALPENHRVKTGRWNVPGYPLVILIDFKTFFNLRDAIYYDMWDAFRVNSAHGYGDYDESCIFAWSVGLIIENFYNYYRLNEKKVIALFNEWMLGMGALYLRKYVPTIATMFITHATTVGRSIAGNDKPLYSHIRAYNGDQMAYELNVEAKHSLEKQTARYSDCFATVSENTAIECEQLLEKKPDIITPNGFEKGFVPEEPAYTEKRAAARQQLLQVVEKLTGKPVDKNAFLIAISGRYEYRNKGLDVFIDTIRKFNESKNPLPEIVAFIMVPAWIHQVRADVKYVVENDYPTTTPMQMPVITHWLKNMGQDKIIQYIFSSGLTNTASEKVRILFIPCYFDGNDGIFNVSYYDLLIGMDATVFASYYEPWGYTPLESIAFGIPTVTTDLAGFGRWAQTRLSGQDIREGVAVIKRTDDNYIAVVEQITDTLTELINLNNREPVRKNCFRLSAQAEWGQFIVHYYNAFDIAFTNMEKRNHS